jgi:hypothetical protein
VRSHDGTPMVCDGAAIHGPASWAVLVDQTPVQVVAMLDGATGMVEFTHEDVSVFIAADAPISAITATYRRVPDAG